jgi:hypothetical protein
MPAHMAKSSASIGCPGRYWRLEESWGVFTDAPLLQTVSDRDSRHPELEVQRRLEELFPCMRSSLSGPSLVMTTVHATRQLSEYGLTE